MVRFALLIAGALAAGLALGIGIAFVTGVGHFARHDNGGNGSVTYDTSREASSEFEPQRRPQGRAPVARPEVKPGTDVNEPRLPGAATAPPPLTGPAPAPSPAPGEQTAALPPGPKQLVPTQPGGPLPAWRLNAPHVALEPGKPMIGIVIDDLGIDKKGSARAIKLPAPITLAFLPYATHLDEQTAAARAAGHELLVHMPMQPEGSGADPGPNALMVNLSPEEIRNRLDWALARFRGYVGINNHMGSRFTSDAAGMDVVLADLKRRGLLFLDSRTAGSSVGFKRARALGVPAAVRQVFLDDKLTREAIDYRLHEVEIRAKRSGHAIAIGHPHDVTLEAIEAWVPTLAAKGFQLAPVSALVETGGTETVVVPPKETIQGRDGVPSSALQK